MKSKEEIEQLGKEVHYEFQNQGLNADGCFNQYQGFIKGYNQCQEDMAKDIEYWQGEFEHWHKQAMDMSDNYIKLLNKQD